MIILGFCAWLFTHNSLFYIYFDNLLLLFFGRLKFFLFSCQVFSWRELIFIVPGFGFRDLQIFLITTALIPVVPTDSSQIPCSRYPFMNSLNTAKTELSYLPSFTFFYFFLNDNLHNTLSWRSFQLRFGLAQHNRNTNFWTQRLLC